MDLALDYKQSRVFDCATCDSGMQRLRNCGGQYGASKSPMLVNNRVYRSCPRSLTFPHSALQFCAGLYFDAKENKTWPFPGGPTKQTAYCKELFDFLDGIASEFRQKEHDKQMAEMKKSSSKK